jgi:uncharacterized protein
MLKKYSIPLFFILAYLFTWSNWLPQALALRGINTYEPTEAIALLAGYGPALAAILVAVFTAGRQGLGELFGRLVRWRVGIQWYAVALFLPALTILIAVGLNALTGGPSPDPSKLDYPFGPQDTSLAIKVIILFLVFTLGFDGLGEELGWRGFALPKLMETKTPLTASIILGTLWAVWHFPFARTEGVVLNSVPLVIFVLNLIASAIIYTWIFINTRGSLLPVLLFHAAGNTASNLLPFLPPAAGNLNIYFFAFAINWVIAFVLIYKRSELRQPRKI